MATNRLYTPKCVISYPNLFTPRAASADSEPKYSATFVFDEAAQKSKEFQALKAAMKPAIEEKWGTKVPPNLKNPMLNGAQHGFPEGTVIIRANSKQPPGVVDAQVQRIIDPGEIYPGAIVIATLNCYAWERATGRGVSFGLGNVQKVGDGPRLDNRATAEQDFAPVDAGSAGDGNVDDLFK